jgi:hypothetical protein
MSPGVCMPRTDTVKWILSPRLVTSAYCATPQVAVDAVRFTSPVANPVTASDHVTSNTTGAYGAGSGCDTPCSIVAHGYFCHSTVLSKENEAMFRVSPSAMEVATPAGTEALTRPSALMPET